MNQTDIISLLQGEPKVKNTPIFTTFSDMNVSDQVVSDFSNSLHNYKLKAGETETKKRILDIFRINPYAAIKIMESCTLNVEELVYAFKVLFVAFQDEDRSNGGYNANFHDYKVILNPQRIPYITLLIEAAYQNSVCDIYDTKDMFLEYAVEQDSVLHSKGIRPKYLNSYNIKHILSHIPDNRQIEFINWFWDKHCYAVRKFRKEDTFAGRRVAIMMQSLSDGAIWRHLENFDENISQREMKILHKEKEGIQQFIKNTFMEGHHVSYVQVVLGKDDFYNKLTCLMGEPWYAGKFKEKLDAQKDYEIKEVEERERVKNKHS